ncbi:hypothetical protein AYO38_10825 [bacterium SCGC AG-212-C10]|nr:hypothetical protein AYO38_10825 [bacterium SCGC AG-212-C10]
MVHAAVVLVPLAAIAFAATGWKDTWRRAYSFPVALLAAGGAVAAFLAKESGDPLEEAVRRAARAAGEGRPSFGDHPENGDTAFVFAMTFGIFAIAFWAVNFIYNRQRTAKGGKLNQLPAWTPIASYLVALVPAVLALITMVIAGHSGATLAWKDVGTYAAGK